MAETDLILAGLTQTTLPTRVDDEVGPLIIDGKGRLHVSSTPAVGTEFTLTGAASTNATVLKSSAANLIEISVFNPTAAIIYLKLYNKSTAPTVGTDVPRLTIAVPINSEKVYSFGFVGKRFPSGIGVATTAGSAAADVAAVAIGVQVHGTYLS